MASKIKTVWIIVALLAISSVIWYLNYRNNFSGFLWNDSNDYNQIARNIYDGKGFSTSVLRPINLLHFQRLPHPEISRPPLYPYLLAGFFSVFGANDFAVVLCDGIFYIILVVLVFWVAMELSKSFKIALFSSLTVALSAYFLAMSILGSSDIVYAALFMAFLLFYLKKPEAIFRHGIVTGILYLFRVNTIFWVIPWILVEFNPRGFLTRWRELLKFAAGALIVITPYLIRNYIVTGNPMFSLHKYSMVLQTPSYPGWTIWIQLKDVSVWEFIVNHPYEMLQKIMHGARNLLRGYSLVFHPVAMLSLPLAFIPLIGNDDRTKKIRRFIFWAIILQTLATLPVGPEIRFYLYLFPVVFILFAGMIRELLRSYGKRESIMSAILVLIFFSITYSSIPYMRSEKTLNPLPYIGERLKALTKADDVIASDIAWEISWYADRKTVWLPYDLEVMDRISKHIPINYVFLSIKLVGGPLSAYDNEWKYLLTDPDYFVPGLKPVDVVYTYGSDVGILYRVEGR